MKPLLASLTAALALAGCGNFSNDDLVFMNALPRKDDLVTRIPTGTAGQGLSHRSDGLNGVGQTSDFYANTRSFADRFNGSLDTVLGVIEVVRKWPPTSRETNRRIWGPASDSGNAGFDVRLTLDRDPNTGAYDWTIEHRRRNGGEFFTTAGGHFEPTMDVRKGAGDIHFMLDTARAGGLTVDPNLAIAHSIDITYDTVPPVKVSELIPADGRHDFDYRYEEKPEGGARMDASFGLDNVMGVERIHAISRWDMTGAGRGDVLITQGSGAGLYTQVQCWDSGRLVTYAKDFLTPPVGDAASCVFQAPLP
jgi:hypothetical protein